jgi:hypothetical protein
LGFSSPLPSTPLAAEEEEEERDTLILDVQATAKGSARALPLAGNESSRVFMLLFTPTSNYFLREGGRTRLVHREGEGWSSFSLAHLGHSLQLLR